MQKFYLIILALIMTGSTIFSQSVFGIISNSQDHTILTSILEQTGLDSTLDNMDGPFTVFAPTDAAFGAIDPETLQSVLIDNDLLTAILLYHVVGANAMSGDLTDGQVIPTLNGQDLTVGINADGVFINDAQVTDPDLIAENGVVHVINAVLLPAMDEPTTVMDIIEDSEDHTTLTFAINEAGLTETLRGEGPFTVFAPTNDAFNALPDGTLDAVLADIDLLTAILLYHVVGANALSTDLTDGQIITTLNGQDVTVTINEDGVFINDAQVIVEDLVADNGVVHVINAVLLPAMDEPTTVMDIIEDSEDHTTLTFAINEAGLTETLRGEGPFTVFAPTNDAFNALPDGTLDAVLADEELLTAILLYHVVGTNALSTDLTDGQTITTLNGQDVTVSINEDGVFINDAQVIVEDLVADNGVVHVINAVLLPAMDEPTTVMDIIEDSEDHTTLTFAINEAGLTETLRGEGPFTVFAPTNDAFNALPDGTLDAVLADIDLLTAILLYHVVGANALSTDLTDGQIITTLNGQDVTVTINEDGVFINGAQVTVADLTADNGVVHVIDAVLLPGQDEPFTVFDIISNSDDHATLKVVLELTGLDEALSDPEVSYTVFAPTDAAFEAIDPEVLEAVLADEDLLTAILLYHVALGTTLSTELEDGMEIPSLLGDNLTVRFENGNVFINDAQVTVADLTADNGVVHVIDAVLLPTADPDNVMEIIEESEIHTLLNTAINLAGLAETLRGEGPFTVFAPSDEAFGNLPEGTLEAVLANADLLTSILLYHVVGANALSTDLSDGQMIETLEGNNVLITIDANGVLINDARVIAADLIADNGVVHVIDAVLLPPSSVEDITSLRGLNIYPNPTTDFIIFEYDNISTESRYFIIDMNGRMVETGNTYDNRINIQNLIAGQYNLTITNGSEMKVARFVKM